jgi:hypothetical protein
MGRIVSSLAALPKTRNQVLDAEVLAGLKTGHYKNQDGMLQQGDRG